MSVHKTATHKNYWCVAFCLARLSTKNGHHHLGGVNFSLFQCFFLLLLRCWLSWKSEGSLSCRAILQPWKLLVIALLCSWLFTRYYEKYLWMFTGLWPWVFTYIKQQLHNFCAFRPCPEGAFFVSKPGGAPSFLLDYCEIQSFLFSILRYKSDIFENVHSSFIDKRTAAVYNHA